MKLTKQDREWLTRSFPAVSVEDATRAAKDAAWFAAPGLSEDEHVKWVYWLVSGRGCDDFTPLGYWDDAKRRFFENLIAIESGIPSAVSHMEGIEV